MVGLRDVGCEPTVTHQESRLGVQPMALSRASVRAGPAITVMERPPRRETMISLSPSPVSDTSVVKQTLLPWRDRCWQKEWANSELYYPSSNRMLSYAAQTKLWFPIARTRADITTFGRPTLGELIQFLTGHSWFRRHRFKIDGGPSRCRFCGSEAEDPEHLWPSCRPLDGVRQAIQDECIKNGTSVSFTHPFSGLSDSSATQWLSCWQDLRVQQTTM